VLRLQLIIPFFDQIEFISFNVAKALTLTARPRYLDNFRPLRFGNAEIGAQVTL
jgi:hypothetical protein